MALEQVSYYVLQTPGEWMTWWLFWFDRYLNGLGGFGIPTFRMDNFNGRSALVIEDDDGAGNQFEYWLVLWPVHTASLCPVTYLTGSSGWSSSALQQYSVATEFSPAEIAATLETYIAESLNPFITEITGSSIDDVIIKARTLVDERVINLICAYTITSDDDCEVSTIKMTFWSPASLPGPGTTNQIVVASVMPQPGPAISLSGITEQLQELTEAVNAVTDQDSEVSINHQGTMYSVKAKIITGA